LYKVTVYHIGLLYAEELLEIRQCRICTRIADTIVHSKLEQLVDMVVFIVLWYRR